MLTFVKVRVCVGLYSIDIYLRGNTETACTVTHEVAQLIQGGGVGGGVVSGGGVGGVLVALTTVAIDIFPAKRTQFRVNKPILILHLDHITTTIHIYIYVYI